jgi:hypothetical protein
MQASRNMRIRAPRRKIADAARLHQVARTQAIR